MKEQLDKWYQGLGSDPSPDEYDSKQLAKLYHINIPRGKRINPLDEIDLSGIEAPYVVKVCSPRILHKTDLQGVVLNVPENEVIETIRRMQERFPNENILVEHMSGFQPPEFIIGVIKDPALGHAVMVGAGGILTELYKDATFRLAPCSLIQAMDMLDELTLSPVFNHFRGMTHDKEKLARVIESVSQLAYDMKESLSQLDINPIVYTNDDWVALDVKVMFEAQR